VEEQSWFNAENTPGRNSDQVEDPEYQEMVVLDEMVQFVQRAPDS